MTSVAERSHTRLPAAAERDRGALVRDLVAVLIYQREIAADEQWAVAVGRDRDVAVALDAGRVPAGSGCQPLPPRLAAVPFTLNAVVRASLVTLAVALVCGLCATSAVAAVLPVDCAVPDLRDKLAAANATAAEPDTLSLATGCTYTFDAASDFWFGPEAMVVSSDVTIEGNGATIERSAGPGTPPFRLFFVGADPTNPRTLDYISPGAGDLTLRNLTLSGGLARGGSSTMGGGGAGLGGAIFNQGSVNLDAVTVTDNRAVGGASTGAAGEPGGGGIGEDAAAGRGGGFGGLMVSPGPAGGAPFNETMPLLVANGGGGGGFAVGESGQPGTAGGPGAGGGPTSGLGGIGRSATGVAAPGGDGSGGGGGAVATPAPGGGFGEGGGGDVGSSLDVGDGGGGGVGGGGGANAGGGFGGGGGAGTVLGAGGGDGGFGGGGGAKGAGGAAGDGGAAAGAGGDANGGGGAGLGGGVFNMQGSLLAVNTTFTANTATGGESGDGTDGLGRGGAIFNLNGSVSLSFSTVAGNDAGGGGRAVYDLAYDQATPRSAELVLSRSILSSPMFGAADLRVDKPATTAAGGTNLGTATATLTGGNIVRSSVAPAGGISGSFMTADPQLGALAANGGPVRTMPPADDSPALDTGGESCPATDARGVTRPQSAACDLGAVELVRPTVVVDPPPTAPSPPPPKPPSLPKSPQATKVLPRSIGLAVSPRRDLRLPLRFKVSGRLRAPVGVKLREACNGRMTVTLKRRAKTVVTKKPRLRLRAGRCVYSTRVVLLTRKRIGTHTKKLTIGARFSGNAVLKARSAKRASVRVREAL